MNNTGSETPTEAPAANGAEAPAAEAKPPEKTVQEVLGSMHTTNFPDLLRQLKGCLVVSTYQAGKLVIVRDEGDRLNTHFRSFPTPMGLALTDTGSRLRAFESSSKDCTNRSRANSASHEPEPIGSIVRKAPSFVCPVLNRTD